MKKKQKRINDLNDVIKSLEVKKNLQKMKKEKNLRFNLFCSKNYYILILKSISNF